MEECIRFPTPADVISRIQPREQIDDGKYRLINSTCGQCGHIGLCILEEPFSETPRCRQCYSGLTIEQHRAKMRELQEVMERKLKNPAEAG